jgi:hypothetical protein
MSPDGRRRDASDDREQATERGTKTLPRVVGPCRARDDALLAAQLRETS